MLTLLNAGCKVEYTGGAHVSELVLRWSTREVLTLLNAGCKMEYTGDANFSMLAAIRWSTGEVLTFLSASCKVQYTGGAYTSKCWLQGGVHGRYSLLSQCWL